MAKIHLTTLNKSPQIIELLDNEYTIGRGDTSTIRLNDGHSSRNHAKLFFKDECYYLEDIGSANGTLLNGQKLARNSPQPLTNNDKIAIGQTELVITGIKKKPESISQSEFHAYSESGMLFNSSEYELSATIDASMSMAQLSEEDSSDSASMEKALKRMEAMCIISEAIGNIMDLSKLMTKVLDTVFGLFQKADRSFILLKEGDRYTPVAAKDRANNEINLDKLKISTTVLHTCVEEVRSLLSNSTADDDRFNEAMSIAELSIDSFICSPLVANGDVLGIIQVEGGDGSAEFNETDLQMLTGISGQIAIAVKNISLAKDIEKESAQRANLQRYFSPNMVEMMLSGDVNTELGGKLYNGTIFFSDIIGFTAMSEKMSAEAVVANLNKYFTIMQELIYKNRGNVDKFGGDAIMAFWSVPRYVAGDELKAVLTGVQMQGALYPFNLELKADNLKTIYMGIGINTGDFVAGNIGSEDKIEFTLIGDNVNLAARIETRAGKTQVMCSRETYTRIAQDVSAVELPPVMFKGKSEPQHTYSIRAVRECTGSMTTNIPIKLHAETTEGRNDFFMLTRVYSDAGITKVIIESAYNFDRNSVIDFRCCLNEYHETITFTGRVEELTPKSSPNGIEYYIYTISNISGEKLLTILNPGFKYVTTLSWEEMSREREVEGN